MTTMAARGHGSWHPMSVGQIGLWFEQAAKPASNAYNLAICVRFNGQLQRAPLEQALTVLADRHPLLTARFAVHDDVPSWQEGAYPLHIDCLSPQPCDEESARQLATELLLRPYRLSQEPSVRIAIASITDGGSVLALGCHHIVADLHSAAVLLQDLEALCSEVGPAPGSADVDFRSFCDWQNGQRDSRREMFDQRFWKAELSPSENAPPGLLRLPEPAPSRAAAGRLALKLPPAVVVQVENAAREAGTTMFVVLLTALQALLAHRFGESRIVIGTPTSGRGGRRFEQVVGYFANLLPLVYEHKPDEPFRETLNRQAARVRRSLMHSRLPYARISRLVAANSACTVPFDATLSYQTSSLPLPSRLLCLALGLAGGRLILEGQQGTALNLSEPQPQFPLGLMLAPTDEGLIGALHFDAALIDAPTAQSLLDDWLQLAAACVQSKGESLNELLGRTTCEEASHAHFSLREAVDAALVQHASRVALEGPTGGVTYSQLDAWVCGLAKELRGRSVVAGDRVAVIGNGGIESVPAMLAAWRCGATFVPIDDQLPPARAQSLLAKARVSAVVICGESAPAWVHELRAPVVLAQSPAGAGFAKGPNLSPSDPAWLMFTSGTTGEPKAAVIPHEAALLHAQAMQQRLSLSPQDRVLQFSSLSFDEHAEEIFPALLAGACVVFAPGIRQHDPEYLLLQVRESRVSVLHLPTSYWHVWMLEAKRSMLTVSASLRLVNVGGEAASPDHLRTWAAQPATNRIRWINSYGLTEAAVTSFTYEWSGDMQSLSGMSAVPIGRPIGATLMRIVDTQGGDVPTGTLGELWLGGKGVGLGYFDSPAETATKFYRQPGVPPVRWLRTGDMARVDEMGDVVLIGRLDGALKIRGARIEPQALEAAVLKHPAVRDVVAVSAAERGYDLHIATRLPASLDEAALRAWLHQELPELPRPSRVCIHSAIPRTPGLKPDLTALRQLANAASTSPVDERHADPVSRTVASMMGSLLGRDSIGPNNNFFECGGDSLLAMRLVARVRRAWNVPFDISDFLAEPTPSAVAALCGERRILQAQLHQAPAEDRHGPRPLSSAQQRALRYESALRGADGPSIILRLPESLPTPCIGQALDAAVARHPLLMAEVTEAGCQSTWVATRDRVVPRELKVNLPACLTAPRLAALLRKAYEADALAPTPTALLEAVVFDGKERGRYLLLRARYSTVDGGSVPLLIETLAAACEGTLALADGGSYQEYVAAEAAWRMSTGPQEAREYWQTRLIESPAPAWLPSMANTPPKVMPSRRIRLSLGSAGCRQLRSLAATEKCGASAVLLAAFVVWVSRHLAEPDVLIGMPVSLRGVFGVDDMVGPSLNPLPWRGHVDPVDRFVDVLRRTQSTLLQTLRHAALPYEEIMAACGLHSLRASPLPIQFVVQPAARGGECLPTIQSLVPLRERDAESPVALQVNVEAGETVQIEFEYQCQVLSDRQAVTLLRRFRVLLAGLLAAPELPVVDARMESLVAATRALQWCPPPVERDSPALLHGALRLWAASEPSRVAIVCGSRRISYGELNRLTDHHAAHLVAAGVQPGDRVLVRACGGVQDVLAVMSTLKAGAVYVPVEPHLPRGRAELIARFVNARAVIGAVGSPELPFVPVDLHPDRALPFAPPDITGDSSAYILFTSGTTGEPKGVEVSHRAALVTLREMRRRFGLNECDVFYGTAALEFDLSVFDVFASVDVGACLVRAELSAPHPEHWATDVAAHGVTVWNSVPAGLELLLEAARVPISLSSLRLLLVSGDWVPLSLPGAARERCPGARFVALGGATEAAIWSNWQEVHEVNPVWSSVPYGRALDGHAMYVLDPGGWSVPTGTPGEIYIGGAGLAKGYWSDPERTAECFRLHRQTGQRLYRTGDLGRYMEDGAIEILGRVDRQVKVRGRRVEPAAVEAVLARAPGVRRAIVHPFGPPRSPRGLAAYLLLQPDCALPLADLRQRARAELPEPMRPAHYQRIESLPLGANGKLDRSRLPAPEVSRAEGPAESPQRSLVEDRVAALWQQLLPKTDAWATRDVSFFALGGDSLQAVRLLGQVKSQLGWEPSLSQWLADPTLDALLRLGMQDKVPHQHGSTRAIRSTERLVRHVRLDPELRFRPLKRSDGHRLFITGGSGLIGSRLTVRLLRDRAVDVVCLARPGVGEGLMAQLRRLGADESMVARACLVEGDLALPRFGLSAGDFENLAGSISQVFHAGARVDLAADYDALAQVNVGGTHEVIRLAAHAGAHLHHVSSIGVLPYGAGKRVTELDPIDVEGALSTGYCETKWVAERIVRLAMSRGLVANIYRPGLTVGLAQAPQASGLLFALLLLADAVQAVPELDLPLDLVTAEYAAAAISHIARDAASQGRTFHLTHPRPMALPTWLSQASNPLSTLPRLSFDVWRERLRDKLLAMEPHLATLAALLADRPEAEITPAEVDCANTLEMLGRAAADCEPVAEILESALRLAKRDAT